MDKRPYLHFWVGRALDVHPRLPFSSGQRLGKHPWLHFLPGQGLDVHPWLPFSIGWVWVNIRAFIFKKLTVECLQDLEVFHTENEVKLHFKNLLT